MWPSKFLFVPKEKLVILITYREGLESLQEFGG